MSSTIIRYLFASSVGRRALGQAGKLALGTDVFGAPGWHTFCGSRSLNKVNILVVDNDSSSQRALQQVFDAEGWRVRVVPVASEALRELARGRWTLVVVNVALAEIAGPLFNTLKDLAQAEPEDANGQKLLSVLFLVPGPAARWAQPVLDREGLSYAMKPLHLHDFLAKISDLLLETGAIPQPIREAVLHSGTREHRLEERGRSRGERSNRMFASRDDYVMTEEELAEFERQEEQSRKRRREQEKGPELL